MSANVRANLLLLAISFAVAALVAEAALRWRIGPPVVFRFPQEYYEPDPGIGHRMVPSQQAFTHQAPVSINAHGLRDAEYPQRPASGTVRVLALGDSQTFGNGLPLLDTWPKQLERDLGERFPDRRWEVLNAGVSGTDTWQHERMLRGLLEVYDVDAVVLALYVNDVTRRPDPVRPSASRTNTTEKRIAYVAKRSALVTALWQARAVFAPKPQRIAAERERKIVTGESDRAVEAGWVQVERSLTAMRDEAARRGAGFLLAILPRRDQVAGRVSAVAFNERAGAITGAHGIPAVDLLPPLRNAYAENGSRLFIPWDGHNTALANAVVARALAGPVAVLTLRVAAPVPGP